MWEAEYSRLINRILYSGERKPSRAGDTYSLFGEALAIDLHYGFPLLHGRKMFYEGVLGELAAFLRGPKHIDDFKKFGCNFWDSWGAEKGGELELDYGNAWIDFNGVNQLEELVDKLKNNPNDRRMLVSNWRPDRLAELSLPCCHILYQWYVRDGKHLDMIWYQRSVDTMVGLPSNVISCAAFNIILAHQCGYRPGRIKLLLGDTHIYSNHIEPTLVYLRQLQSILTNTGDLNKLKMQVDYSVDSNVRIDNFKPDMINIGDYNPQPAVKFDLNV